MYASGRVPYGSMRTNFKKFFLMNANFDWILSVQVQFNPDFVKGSEKSDPIYF